ncbi:MAG: CPBP family intramembrane glutamic endopeptidase [Bacteroidia bacterium]
MLNELISSILQLLVFAAIPFVVYLIREKKATGFLDWCGLKSSPQKANMMALLVILLLTGPIILLNQLSPEFREIMLDPKSVTGKIRLMGAGWETIVTIFLVALIKTALAEELFFRGFVAKRLIALWGLQTGNIVQAIIFGAIHTLLFAFVTPNLFFLVVIFIFPAVGSYFMVVINEKMAGGSIIPGWIAHGLANIFSYLFFGFFA